MDCQTPEAPNGRLQYHCETRRFHGLGFLPSVIGKEVNWPSRAAFSPRLRQSNRAQLTAARQFQVPARV